MPILWEKKTGKGNVLLLQFFKGVRISLPGAPFILWFGSFQILLTLKEYTGGSPVMIQARIQKTKALCQDEARWRFITPAFYSLSGKYPVIETELPMPGTRFIAVTI